MLKEMELGFMKSASSDWVINARVQAEIKKIGASYSPQNITANKLLAVIHKTLKPS
jgi:hypothetical protein